MSNVAEMNLGELQTRARRATGLLKAMSNPVRLLVLCQLAEGEKSVGELERVVDVSQSALSQHLAVLRDQGIVAIRREAQTIRYRIDDPAAVKVVATLAEIFCPPDMKAHR